VYDAQRQTATLSVVDGALLLEVVGKAGFPEPDTPPRPGPPATRLAFTGTDLLVALDPPQSGTHSDFLRGPDGRIAWFRLGGRLYRRAE
jgi:hypothetical protein